MPPRRLGDDRIESPSGADGRDIWPVAMRADIPNEWISYPLILILVISAVEVGAWLARRVRVRGRTGDNQFLSSLAIPSLGLLALMIGFTFSMSLSRFEARKAAVVNEANAIGTAALRGSMLDPPFDTQVSPLFKRYTTLRIATRGAPLTSSVDALHEAADLQRALWRVASAAKASNPRMVPTGLFIEALNAMIDMDTSRQAATRNDVPGVVFIVLTVLATVTFGYMGFGEQVAGAYRRAAVLGFAGLVGCIIIMTIDLDRPQGGFITVSQQPLIDLAASMH